MRPKKPSKSSSDPRYMKNMSPMYLSQTHGFIFSPFKNFLSKLIVNILTYIGANLVPIAIPDFWCTDFQSNSIKLCLRRSSANSANSCSSKCFPSACEPYEDTWTKSYNMCCDPNCSCEDFCEFI